MIKTICKKAISFHVYSLARKFKRKGTTQNEVWQPIEKEILLDYLIKIFTLKKTSACAYSGEDPLKGLKLKHILETGWCISNVIKFS